MSGVEAMQHRGALALCAAGFLLALFPLVPSYHWQLVTDDSYYYYQIARGVSETGRLTFDGDTLASGFHPLWMAICVLLYLVSDGLLPYVVTILSLGLFMAYFFYCRRLVAGPRLESRTALLFLLLLTANPVLASNGWNSGLETPLAMLFLIALLEACFFQATEGRGSLPRAAVLCSLLFLTRLDSILFAYPLMAFVFRRQLASHRLAAALPAIVLLGHVAVHTGLFGVAVPASTDAVRFLSMGDRARQYSRVFHTGYFIDFPVHLRQAGRNFLEVVTTALGVESRLFGSTAIAKLMAIAAAALVLGQLLVLRRRNSRHTRFQAAVSERLLVAGISLVLLAGTVYVTTVRLFQFRSWYYPPLAIVLIFAGLLVVSADAGRVGVDRWLVVAISAVALVSAASTLALAARPERPCSRARVIGPALERAGEGRVGAFNAGIYGWASRGKVVNLDGVANQSAFESFRRMDFLGYLSRARIAYIFDVDAPAHIRQLILDLSRPDAASHFELEFVAEWPDRTTGEIHRLLRLRYSDGTKAGADGLR